MCLLGVATGRPTQNITIEVPYGTTNHGDPESFCTPATWIDIASFLLFNFVAHGATVVPYPGETTLRMTLRNAVVAIVSPTYGVIRAFNFIMRLPLLMAKGDDLKMAARSGALCMLVRSSSWKPQQGDNIRNALIKDPSTNVSTRYVPTYSYSRPIKLTNVSLSYQSTASLSIYRPPWLNDMTRFWSYIDTSHGESRIELRFVFGLSEQPQDAQYKFAFVPRNAKVFGLLDSTPSPSVPDKPPHRSPNPFESSVSTPEGPKYSLASSSNLARGTVALLQLLYALVTVYHTNGDQVNQYGFAAPGLTVIPYAIMSGLNLLASLVAHQYPTLYLVRSSVMDEAERRTGKRFHYVVGRIVDDSGTDSDNTVMNGWSEIAGSFKDDNEVLHVSPSAEDERIEICNSSRQRIYVPACPRFQRRDDTKTSPLRQFNEWETRQDEHGLEFPRYMARRQRALIQPSFFSISRLSSQMQSCRPPIRYIPLSKSQRPQCRSYPFWGLNAYETLLVFFISGAEFFIMLAVSNFSGQQSTLVQRAIIVTWLFSGSLFVALIPLTKHLTVLANSKKVDLRSVLLKIVLYIYEFSYGAPLIGGFVVVSQMLKAYGVCYKFV